jgi:hypothetical protein
MFIKQITIEGVEGDVEILHIDKGALSGAPGVRAAAKRRRWPPTMACSNCIVGWSGTSTPYSTDR